MKERLAIWAILAGGIALTGTAFFASAGVTHWVMSQHRTEVVVRPGPTVYVTVLAKHGHARHRTLPAQAPAVPVRTTDVTMSGQSVKVHMAGTTMSVSTPGRTIGDVATRAITGRSATRGLVWLAGGPGCTGRCR